MNPSLFAKRFTTTALLSCALTASWAIAADSCEAPSSSALDWVPLSEMTSEQRARVASQCCGGFVVPQAYQERIDQFSDVDIDSLPLEAGSDASLLEDGGETSVMEGNVFVRQGTRELTADSARITRSANAAELTGNVTFRDPGVLLVGDRALVKMNEGEAEIDNAQFVLHETGLRGYAAAIRISEANSLTLNDGGFTSCEPGSEDWFIKSEDVDIDTEAGRGTVTGATVEILGVPVFYLPWAQFPIDDRRMSGFLVPEFSISSDGPDFSAPYYLNLAPNYDATITPRFIADRGAGLESEVRWMNEHQHIALSGAYWERDRIYDSNRWLGGVQQTGGVGDHWYSKIDYTRVSDIDYFRDLGTYGLEVRARSNLKQFGAIGYQTDYIHAGIEARQYQAISVTTQNRYRQLPHVWAAFSYPILDGLRASFRVDATEFEAYDNLNLDEGNRAMATAELLWRKEWLPGYLEASSSIYAKYYEDTAIVIGDDTINSTSAIHHIEGGLFFERFQPDSDYSWVIEPKFHYNYAQYIDQSSQPIYDTTQPLQTYESLFRTNRFSGGDRVGDDNRFTLAATTRVINNNNGQEWLSFSVAQGFYNGNRYVSLSPRLTKEVIDNPSLLPDITDIEQLELDSLTQSRSDLMLKTDVALGREWSFTSDLNWNTSIGRINQSANYLQYSKYRQALVNVGMIYQRRGETVNIITGQLTDRDTWQSHVSAYIPLTENGWSLFGRWTQDLTYSRQIDFLTGFEYESCCWRIALAYQRWVDPGTGTEIDDLDQRSSIRFQVELKGIGSGQSSVDKLLSGIYGYQNYEENN